MIRTFLIAVLLVFGCALTAFANQKPDLIGFPVVAKGGCTVNGSKPSMCFVVEKEGVLYLAMHDERGELSIHRLKVTDIPPNGAFTSEHVDLLWARKML